MAVHAPRPLFRLSKNRLVLINRKCFARFIGALREDFVKFREASVKATKVCDPSLLWGETIPKQEVRLILEFYDVGLF